MNILSINKFNAIADIIAAIMTGTMLLWMFLTITSDIYYLSGVVMAITNIIGLIQQKKHEGKLVGNILGLIAGVLHLLSGLLAFPAMVLYILASVFTFRNKVN